MAFIVLFGPNLDANTASFVAFAVTACGKVVELIHFTVPGQSQFFFEANGKHTKDAT